MKNVISTIKQAVGNDFTKELETAWEKALDEMINVVDEKHEKKSKL